MRFPTYIAPWVLVTTTVFAAPAINRRATPNTAGIGVELEGKLIKFKNMALDKIVKDNDNVGFSYPEEMLEQVKGKPLVDLTDPNGKAISGKHKHWAMTAEILRSDFVEVVPEIIVDGLITKLGDGKMKEIGSEIVKFLDTWQPARGQNGKDRTIGVEGYSKNNAAFKDIWEDTDTGKWVIDEPKLAGTYKNVDWGLKVTSSAPLRGIYRLIKSWKTGTKPELLQSNMQILWIEPSHFAKSKLAHLSSTDEDYLGFMSILATYAHRAASASAENGPKHLVSIMPRTDFLTMYNKFAKPIIEKGRKKQPQPPSTPSAPIEECDDDRTNGCTAENDSLSCIVKLLVNAAVGNNLATLENKFKWNDVQFTKASDSSIPSPSPIPSQWSSASPPPPPPPPPPRVSPRTVSGNKNLDRRAELQSRATKISKFTSKTTVQSLSVKEWLEKLDAKEKAEDLVATYEKKYRHGQVGGLGSRMELIYPKGDESVPIWEFRDLYSQKMAVFETYLPALEKAVIKLHETPKVTAKQRRETESLKEKTCRRKCIGNRILKTVPNKSPVCEACPKGQQANKAGDKCVVECPKNQARIGANEKCEACPSGKSPSTFGDKCQSPAERQGKCPNGKILDPTWENQDATTANPKCIDAPKDNATPKQGKCPTGKVLDPKVTGQDENTANPKCVDAPKNNDTPKQGKCPTGKVLDPAVKTQDENTANPKCVDAPKNNDTPKQGKCPTGKVLDPAVKTQDENTVNPKCVDAAKKSGDVNPKQGRCPNGKILDPKVTGQDENTANPKCVDAPKGNATPKQGKCAKGKVLDPKVTDQDEDTAKPKCIDAPK